MKYCITLFLIICFTFSAGSQNYNRLLFYGIQQGLSQNSVHAIYRDSEDILWIGTQDGLNVFDGKIFTVYKPQEGDTNSISDQFITGIKEDKAGNIWVGTRNGLNYFNRQDRSIKRIYADSREKEIFQADYTYFQVQQDNKLLVARREKLFVIDPVKGVELNITSRATLTLNWFLSDNYQVWALGSDGFIYYARDIRSKKIKRIAKALQPLATGWSDYDATVMGDEIYVYKKIGITEVLIYNARDFELSGKILLPGKFDHLLVEDGKHIIASAATGIFITGLNEKGKWYFRDKNAMNKLPGSNILTTFLDKDDNLWIGTAGHGFCISNPSFNNFTFIASGNMQEGINCITAVNDQYYAGTYSGLNKIVFTNGEPYFLPVLKDKYITALATDHKQRVWAAVKNEGFYLFDKHEKLISKIPYPNFKPGMEVMHMKPDHQGRMMISTTLGFLMQQGNDNNFIQFSETSAQYPISGDYVLNAFQDKEGRIYVANNNGLDVFSSDLHPLISYSSEDIYSSFLKRTIITSVTQDASGAIWIATLSRGVYKWHNNKYTHYSINQGLISDVVYSVVCDVNNRIWAVTSSGVNILNNDENRFSLLTSFDGIPKMTFDFGAVYTNDNKIFLGSSEGLLICEAGNIKTNDPIFEAYVSGVSINGKSFPISQKGLSLVPDDKLIEFKLGASPAFYTGNVLYQYRLQGHQEEWASLKGDLQSILYNGLPYGNLKLQVRAANAVSKLAAAPVYELQINSEPPFVKSTFFKVLAGAASIALMFIAFGIYNKRKLNRQLQQIRVENELQKERTRIGRDLHDNIGAYTSAMLAGLNRITLHDDKQQSQMASIKEYGSNIMNFLRETIWMLNERKLTVIAFTDRIKNYMLRIAKNYPEIDFRFHENISHDKTLQPAIMLNLFRILQEALQNACKHASARTIEVTINSNALLSIYITDDGTGFDPTLVKDPSGLINMRERANEIGFTTTILSEPGKSVIIVNQNTADAALEQLN